MQKRNQTTMLLLSITFFFLMLTTSSAVGTIAVNQSIADGGTIVSENEKFELGFFSPGSSKNRYLGIWLKNTSPHTVVWVANRETPVISTSAVFRLDTWGTLLLVNGGNSIIWSSNSSASVASINLVAQLLDTGNLVIKDVSDSSKENIIWQSFDYPGDTLMSGMKLGKNFITGKQKYLTSWRSADDPSLGEYTIRLLMVKGKYPQVYMRKGSVIETRIGPYNGVEFAGQPSYQQNSVYTYKLEMVVDQNEMNFVYTYNSSIFSARIQMTPNGRLELWHLNNRNQEWQLNLAIPTDNCDNYGFCGPFGSCSTVTFPNCGCLKGFELKNPVELSPDNWTTGCRRSVALDCGPGEGFLKFSDMKLPDTMDAKYKESMTLEECEVACRNNCSCNAYANPYITAGRSGCLLWFGDLMDVRVYPQNGQDLYVRLAASELLHLQSGSSRKKRKIIKVSLSTSAVMIVLGLVLALYAWSKRKRSNAGNRSRTMEDLDKDHNASNEKGDIELLFFSLPRIAKATSNFSIDNKLGEGGFGPVYKGVLEDGQEIAVKRLSESSQQGLNEFKNELILVTKLQHRNLVKVLGCCNEGEEIMLVYEYLPNKSLDWFIFDDSKKSLLAWSQRLHIIQGIARGLLYLHQDSRLRIVHRDLKAGNILLDSDMNAKISDFGLARMFKGRESEANTKKVVGTLGYISPEYAVNGLFSVKSDIFSFGVLVLEIVSGEKNRAFSHEDHHDNLVSHAWRLHTEDRVLDLIDASLGKSWTLSEVLRTIHIGLLCVQRRPEDRPNISSVVQMLGGEGSLPPPKQPGFFIPVSDSTASRSPSSINEVTVTQIHGR